MRDLVEKTGVPKSAILYYIREGLLPKPHKPKPNQHVYTEEFVERIQFIKYLQREFGATVEQISSLMNAEDFDFSRRYEYLLKHLHILTAPASPGRYSLEEAAQLVDMDPRQLKKEVQRGALFERDGGFTDKELELAKTISRLQRIDGADGLIAAYIKSARSLSRKEIELLRSNPDMDEEALGALLDAALLLKPYIFNMTLLNSYERIEDEG